MNPLIHIYHSVAMIMENVKNKPEIQRKKDKFNFLIVNANKFPPFRVDEAILFGKEMISRGHAIDWISQSEASCNKSYKTVWNGCRVWVGPNCGGTTRLKRLKKNLFRVINEFRMISLARKNNYDFIQIKNLFISALLAIAVSRINKTKFIYWLSYPFPEAWIYEAKNGTARYPIVYYLRGIICKFLLYRLIMPHADHVFVQSEQMKKDVKLMGIPESKLTPVPMGVAFETILHNFSIYTLDTSKNEKIVLYLGTLAKTRKIDFLISVFNKVLKKVPNSKLFLVGAGDDPTDEQLLKNEVKRLGINQSVIFTGFVPRQIALHYVSKADVCVSPFFPTQILNSTSPTKIVEYMAMGKAVVANDHPEQRVVISESGGGICVPYEEEAFAAAIVELLNNPARAKAMGLKARHYVEKHRTYKTIANIVEKKYFQICRTSAEKTYSPH